MNIKEYFAEMGRKGGKRSLKTMTAGARKKRALKAAKASAKVRAAKVAARTTGK